MVLRSCAPRFADRRGLVALANYPARNTTVLSVVSHSLGTFADRIKLHLPAIIKFALLLNA
jgi:hypothetical protein